MAVAIDESSGDQSGIALAAAAEAFERWESMLFDCLVEHGADAQRATELATLIVASVEGAVGLCRAKRSLEPLERVMRQLEAIVGQ